VLGAETGVRAGTDMLGNAAGGEERTAGAGDAARGAVTLGVDRYSTAGLLESIRYEAEGAADGCVGVVVGARVRRGVVDGGVDRVEGADGVVRGGWTVLTGGDWIAGVFETSDRDEAGGGVLEDLAGAVAAGAGAAEETGGVEERVSTGRRVDAAGVLRDASVRVVPADRVEGTAGMVGMGLASCVRDAEGAPREGAPPPAMEAGRLPEASGSRARWMTVDPPCLSGTSGLTERPGEAGMSRRAALRISDRAGPGRRLGSIPRLCTMSRRGPSAKSLTTLEPR